MVKAIEGSSHSMVPSGAIAVHIGPGDLTPSGSTTPVSSPRPSDQETSAGRAAIVAAEVLASAPVERLKTWLIAHFPEEEAVESSEVTPTDLVLDYLHIPRSIRSVVSVITTPPSGARAGEIILNTLGNTALATTLPVAATVSMFMAGFVGVLGLACRWGGHFAHRAEAGDKKMAADNLKSAQVLLQVRENFEETLVAERAEITRLGKEVLNLQTTAVTLATQTQLLSTVSASLDTFSENLKANGTVIADDLTSQVAALTSQVEAAQELIKTLGERSSGDWKELRQLIEELKDPVVLANRKRELDELKKVKDSLKKRSDKLKTQVRANERLLKQVKQAVGNALNTLANQNQTVGTHITDLREALRQVERLIPQMPTSGSPSTASLLDLQGFADSFSSDSSALTPSRDPNQAEGSGSSGNSLQDNGGLSDTSFFKVDEEG